MMLLLRLAVLTMLFIFNCSELFSQTWPDSKGRDFWFTYIPNFHNNEDQILTDAVLAKEHELYIYVGADRPTSGKITWRLDNGAIRTQAFTITDIRQLYTMSVFYRGAELRGVNASGVVLDWVNSDNEKAVLQSFHIEADDDVTVYALNQASLTSDAFLVLPTDALAEDYVVVSYNSDVRDGLSNGIDPASTPSQFAVVATADSTFVNITPSVPTPMNPNRVSQRIQLQEGESYLVQADMRVGKNPDLTGTLIRATKPVAVFSGHQRATLPIDFRGQLASRDCVVEQLNPIRTWGKNGFVTPFSRSSTELSVGYDIYRVVAAYDSTVVYVDGQERTILPAGGFFEDSLLFAKEIQTSRPTLTAQYKKTSGSALSTQDRRTGDPFMMIVPPSEQYMSQYRFISIQSYQYSNATGVLSKADSIYKEQWLNVVIPTSKVATLMLDNVLVNTGLFQQIGASAFSWAKINMTDGVHAIKADTTFGIYVYGYGLANSYGYLGGMSFRPLDITPPVIAGVVSCRGFDGSVTDSLIADSRVSSVVLVPGTENNVIFTLGSFLPPQAVVPFRIALADPYLDGSITVEAVDAVGQKTKYDLALVGFTISPVGLRNDANPLQRSYIVPIDRERCDSFEIENYGLYPHTITSARFKGASTVSSPQSPFTMLPGERLMVRFCRTGTAEQIVSDTLILGDTCVERSALIAVFDEQLDKSGPKVQAEMDVCSTRVDVVINDNVGSDLGLRSARVLDSVVVNCIVTITDSADLEQKYRIDVIDPYLDAIYGFEAVDSADNVTLTIDTIPGFMLSVNGNLAPVYSIDFGACSIGVLTCDTINLMNSGISPILLSYIYVQQNVLFSLPQQQFSIDVRPLGGRASLIACFEPKVADTTLELSDTLELRQGCLVRKIALLGRGKGLIYSGISRCNTPVESTTQRILGGVVAIPQPARENVTLVLERSTSAATVRLVDVSGVTVLERSWSGEPTMAIILDVTGLRPGAYGCRITTDSAILSTMCIIR